MNNENDEFITVKRLNAALSKNYTHVDPTILDRSRITRRHLLWYAANCDKLADYMSALPSSKHDQSYYAHDSGDAYGTPACALGHAAYSNEFPGLQFGVEYQYLDTADIRPVINGGRTHWDTAGTYFFGSTAVEAVFRLSRPTKREVCRRLREIAKAYRTKATCGSYSDDIRGTLDF